MSVVWNARILIFKLRLLSAMFMALEKAVCEAQLVEILLLNSLFDLFYVFLICEIWKKCMFFYRMPFSAKSLYL